MKAIITFLFLTFVVGSTVFFGGRWMHAPNLYLVVDNASGLEHGAEVAYQGFKVGEVTDVGLCMETAAGGYAMAELTLDRDAFAGLYEEMAFRVERTSVLDGAKRVVIYDRDVAGTTPLSSGSTIVETGFWAHLAERSGAAATELLHVVRSTKRNARHVLGDVLSGIGHMLAAND